MRFFRNLLNSYWTIPLVTSQSVTGGGMAQATGPRFGWWGVMTRILTCVGTVISQQARRAGGHSGWSGGNLNGNP